MFGYIEPDGSEPKHDRPSIHANGIRLVANLDYPPLTHFYRHMRAYAGGAAMVVGLGAYFLLFAGLRTRASAAALFSVLFLVPKAIEYLVRNVPVIIWTFWGQRGDELRLRELEALNEKTEARPLIAVRGRAVELLEFARLPNVGFEPRVFRAAGLYLRMSPESRVEWLVEIGVLGALAFFELPRPRSLLVSLPLMAMWAVLLYGFFHRPAFYRIIPGRLDIMKFRTLSEHPDHVEQLDLRRFRVHIDLTRPKKYISIERVSDNYVFDRTDTYDPLGFALALALAAKTTAPTPNIPMDSLLG